MEAVGGGQNSGLSLAQKLAKLHSSPAPVPRGLPRPAFGFTVMTCVGRTPQNNHGAVPGLSSSPKTGSALSASSLRRIME